MNEFQTYHHFVDTVDTALVCHVKITGVLYSFCFSTLNSISDKKPRKFLKIEQVVGAKRENLTYGLTEGECLSKVDFF